MLFSFPPHMTHLLEGFQGGCRGEIRRTPKLRIDRGQYFRALLGNVRSRCPRARRADPHRTPWVKARFCAGRLLQAVANMLWRMRKHTSADSSAATLRPETGWRRGRVETIAPVLPRCASLAGGTSPKVQYCS